MAKVTCFLGFFLSLGLHEASFAHDLWLIPPEKPIQNGPIRIRANSGDEFPISEQAPDTSLFEKRLVVHPDQSRNELDPAGKEEKSGIMQFTQKKSGLHIVAVVTKPKLITLEAKKFNDYLIGDGMFSIYKLRAKEGTLNEPGKERYRKSPKVIFRVGEGEGEPTQVVGLPLEIIPQRDPTRVKIGETLFVRVLFEEKPLADANLGWDHPGDGEAPSGTVRTNTKGEARIPISERGLMTIRLTHMTRPKAKDYEWESYWTTLTFVVP